MVIVVSGRTVKCGPWQIDICLDVTGRTVKCGPWLIEIFYFHGSSVFSTEK